MTQTCLECGEDFKEIGKHWSYNESHIPDISRKQREVVTGSLMGDADINCQKGNWVFRLRGQEKQYLEYVSDILNPWSNSVHLNAPEGKYGHERDYFGFMTSTSDYFVKQRQRWYDGSEKSFPRDVTMTSIVLKHWYCQDGDSCGGSISLTCCNEDGNEKKLSSYFDEHPVSISNFTYREGKLHSIDFSKGESEWLWNWMGDPPPGFEYKWPDGFSGTFLS